MPDNPSHQSIKRSLTFKLGMPIIVVGVLAIVLVVAFSYWRSQAEFEREVESESENIISSLLISADLYTTKANIVRVIGTLAARDNIISLVMIDPRTRNIIASNNFAEIDKPFSILSDKINYQLAEEYIPSNLAKRVSRIHEDRLYRALTVHMIDEPQNRLRPFVVLLTLDKSAARSRARQEMIWLLFIFSTGFVITLLITLTIQQRFVLAPLSEIQRAIKHSWNKTNKNPIAFTSNDEMGQLAASYNRVHNERLRLDQDFQEVRRRMDGVSGAAPVLLAYMNEQGHFPWVNPAFNRFFGIPEGAVPVERAEALFGKMYEKAFRILVAKTIAARQPQTQELELTNAANELRYLHLTLTVDLDEASNPRGMFICAEDLTPQKHAEEQIAQYAQDLEFQAWALEEQKEKAEQATHTKSAFLASMSHEIRTPLNGIIGMLKLIVREDISDRAAKHCHLASISAESLLSLINDILDFSKIEAGKLTLEHIGFDITALLMEICEIFQLRVKDKPVELVLDIQQVSQRFVRGDPHRLRQIFNNLVSNAIKFTSEGSIHITAASEPLTNGQVLVKASVTDTGIGIAHDKLSELFDAFSQADSSTTRKFGGTGLGLGIAKELCEMMSGHISVTSQLDQGSCFSFDVRMESSNEADIGTEMQLAPILNANELNIRKILLVEDNTINVEVALGILEDFDIVAEVAKHGKEAIEKLSALPAGDYFDLILMDCQMPEMDGFTATRHIRDGAAGDRFRGVPIIAMTANAMEGDRERCLSAGMNDYLSKPVDVSLLERKLAYWSQSSNTTTETQDLGEAETLQDKIWDRNAALKRLRWKKDRLQNLVNMYLETADANFAELAQAITEQSLKTSGKLAHRIKGSAGNLGLMQFYKKLQLAESLAHEQMAEELIVMLPELTQSYQDAVAALREQPS